MEEEERRGKLGRWRNQSLDDGERRACLDGQLPKLPSRDLFGSNQLVQRKQSADHEMREEEDLQYKSLSVEQMVKKEEPLKAEEEDPVCKESRRREKKQFGGESRRNQSPDEELREAIRRKKSQNCGLFPYGGEGGSTPFHSFWGCFP